MTAEIAILNKSAVALAADSAVTIGGEESRKIFNTVNKLFTLSKHQPVGIMVCGSADIMEMPWETIIKVYRQNLGERNFAHLEDYVKDFLSFLSRNRGIFPAADQKRYFTSAIFALYRRIKANIDEEVKSTIEKKGKCTNSEIRQMIRSEIQSCFDSFKKAKNLPGFTEKFASKLRLKFKKVILEAQKRTFEKLPLDATDRKRLGSLAGSLFVRDKFVLDRTSGIVIAGFGTADNYPRLKDLTVEGVIENRLRFKETRKVEIGPGNHSASIVPIAQGDVVRSFIEGMDQGLEDLLDKFLDTVFSNYPNLLLKHIPAIKGAVKVKTAKKINEVSQDILRKFRDQFQTFKRRRLIDPIVSTVAVLPKDELAAMAEALVSLTSFKRKYSFSAETVGGPIDVAVLSKGDGFVWIKRKHYFKPEFNPHFLTNYFK
jgi:hypothetical protein